MEEIWTIHVWEGRGGMVLNRIMERKSQGGLDNPGLHCMERWLLKSVCGDI